MSSPSKKHQLDLFGDGQKSVVQKAKPKLPAFEPCNWCREQWFCHGLVPVSFEQCLL
jgi:hypothetical protein